MAGVGVLIDALNEFAPATNFEKFVIITLKFFSSNRFLIDIDMAELMNQVTAMPVVFIIPGNWRNAISETITLNMTLYSARYDLQCMEQQFSLLMVQGDGHIAVSLRHKKTNNDGRIYAGGIADRKIEELRGGLAHSLDFANFLQKFLIDVFKYPMEQAFINKEPLEFYSHYTFPEV